MAKSRDERLAGSSGRTLTELSDNRFADDRMDVTLRLERHGETFGGTFGRDLLALGYFARLGGAGVGVSGWMGAGWSGPAAGGRSRREVGKIVGRRAAGKSRRV